MMNANPQQTTLDQLPDEQLAVHGWNQYRALETARRQAQLCEQNITAIAQELDKRVQARQEAQGKQEAEKKSEREVLLDELMAKLDKRNALPSPASNGTPPATESKAE